MEYPAGFPIINCHSHYHDWETIDEVKERAHKWGIHYYAMSALGPMDGLSGNNETIKRAFQEHPDFIIGLYHFDLDSAPPEDIYQAKEDGFLGVKIIGTLKPYDSEAYYEHYDAIEKTGLPILFHTGFLSVMPEQRRKTVSMMNMRPGMLDTLGRAFPDLKMIGAHLGAPWFLEAVATAYFHPNAYFDLSGGIVRTMSMAFYKRLFAFRDAGSPDMKGVLFPPDEEKACMKVVGKMMFGTDNPPPERLVEFTRRMLDGVGADDETKARVWYKNAAELFGVKV